MVTLNEVKVTNPFILREALTVALEVSRYQLSYSQIEVIKQFISRLKNVSDWIYTTPSEDLRLDLKQCIWLFINSKTGFWIREDFTQHLIELEKQL